MYTAWLICIFAFTGGFSSPVEWVSSWVQWDSKWYFRIWQNGYPKSDPRALVFPPGYSFLVGTLSHVSFFNFYFTAMLFNIAAMFCALSVACEVLSRRFLLPAVPLFLFSLSSPTQYFAFAAYSDTVFMLILWLAIFLAVERPDDPTARIQEFLLLFFAPWIRITGFALALWSVFDRRAAFGTLFSLIAWLSLNTYLGGHPFYFLKAQRLFVIPEGSIIDGVRYTFSMLLAAFKPEIAGKWTQYVQFIFLPAFYLVVIASAAVWICSRKQWLIGSTALAILFMSHNQSFWRSGVRYDLPLMPLIAVPLLYLAQGDVSKLRRICVRLAFTIVVIGQFAMQITFARLFKSGAWAF